MGFLDDRGRVRRSLLVLWLCAVAALCGCGGDERPLAPKTQTWAELRTVRRGVFVTPPGGEERVPYVRERLVDGQIVRLDPGALAWLRRDGGATLLVRGPARLRMFTQSVAIESGRVFVDAPDPMTLETPAGALQLSKVRTSIEIEPDGAASAYVLDGEVRTNGEHRALPGERITLAKDGTSRIAPELAWDDWTGGLATADRVAEPAPFGVGTVGGREPGSLGEPRFALAIQRQNVRVTIDGELAITEVDQRFFNSSSRTVEGIYRFRSPERASLSRFGVDRAGELVWGRVKERVAAAAGYQANVYAGSQEDPALLEWEAPGQYRARLYPIGPGETRRVVVRYSEWLARTGERGERRTYVYPMAAEGSEESLPQIEELTVTVDLSKAGAEEVRAGMQGVRTGNRLLVRAQDFVPRADLAIELFDRGNRALTAYRASHVPELELLPATERAEAGRLARGEADYLLVPVRARDVPHVAGGLDLAIVIDASAANEPAAMALARAATAALLAQLGSDDRVVVWAGAEELRPVVPTMTELATLDDSGRQRLLAALATLERGGATDLGTMLARAASSLDPTRRGAVLYLGDGLATVGELSLTELENRLAKLPRPVRLFSFGIGARVDMALLAGLSAGGFAERVDSGNAAARAALRLLELAERPALLGTAIDLGPSVERLYPRKANAWVTDDTVLVIGRTRKNELPKSLTLKASQGETQVALETVELADDGDLRRRWAGERMAELLADGAGRAAMVDLGSRYGIITPVTSLYVPTQRELEAERPARRGQDGEQQVLASASDTKEGGRGTRAKGEEGSMGSASSKSSNRSYAVRGPADDSDPRTARQAAMREAQEFGMIGLVTSDSEVEPKPPTAGWGRDESGTGDPPSPPGNLWGAPTGDALGAGWLGLSSVGEGGAGKGEGAGLAAIGSLGKGAGAGTGQGFGSGQVRLGGVQRATAPRVRSGALQVGGKAPAEVIQRIVRQSFGRFRLCYEQGLQRNPSLEGRVSARLEISGDGEVTNVADAGSDLPDDAVVGCVLGAHRGLSFPRFEQGKVSVTVPILLAPGGRGARDESPGLAPAALVVQVDALPRRIFACSGAANAALDERVALWRERLARVGAAPLAVEGVYRRALARCEAPSWRERRRLLSLLLDALPKVSDRVELWRTMFGDRGAADVLYRGIVARVKSPSDMRELHRALGLRSIDPGLLARYLREAKTPQRKLAKLRGLVAEWPDDFELALALMHALEDAGDRGGAREFAERLRARPEIDAHVRTQIGELHLRLAASASAPAERLAYGAAARRAFGEIVEFAPDDPVARRRLGDLLRAHGWYADAQRQYETLAKLAPDDTTVPLLLAAAAEGQGQLEAAVRWTEKAAEGAPPSAGSEGASSLARVLSGTYLAWGRLGAREGKRDDELAALVARAERVLADDRAKSNGSTVRVTLTWSHPELNPTLWSNALGSPMPASEGDVSLGIAQVRLPKRPGAKIEIRLEPDAVAHAARLGAGAVLTVVFDELGKQERVIKLPIRFERTGPPTISFAIDDGQVTRG
jgi:tetratricopeptide (TPR) repeat protein